MVIMDRLEDTQKRLWYIQQCIENGWSRNVLNLWIESDLYGRQGKAITNFKMTLLEPYSDLAHQTIKDPYNFEFLTLDKAARDRAGLESL